MREDTIRKAIAHLQARIPRVQSTARRAHLLRILAKLRAELPEEPVRVPW